MKNIIVFAFGLASRSDKLGHLVIVKFLLDISPVVPAPGIIPQQSFGATLGQPCATRHCLVKHASAVAIISK